MSCNQVKRYFDEMYLSRNFKFENSIIEQYTESDCGNLAIEIFNKIPGCKMMKICDADFVPLNSDEGVHIFVELPNKQCVDIRGIYLNKRMVLNRWLSDRAAFYQEFNPLCVKEMPVREYEKIDRGIVDQKLIEKILSKIEIYV